MEKIKIYKNSYGDKFVKVKVEFIMDVPIDEDIISIDKDGVEDAIMEIDSSDLADMVFENFDKFHIVTKSDNIEHVEEKIEYTPYKVKPIKITYIPLQEIIKLIKIEIDKEHNFIDFHVSNYEEISENDINEIKKIGFNIYRENNVYWITW